MSQSVVVETTLCHGTTISVILDLLLVKYRTTPTIAYRLLYSSPLCEVRHEPAMYSVVRSALLYKLKLQAESDTDLDWCLALDADPIEKHNYPLWNVLNILVRVRSTTQNDHILWEKQVMWCITFHA